MEQASSDNLLEHFGIKIISFMQRLALWSRFVE